MKVVFAFDRVIVTQGKSAYRPNKFLEACKVKRPQFDGQSQQEIGEFIKYA